MSQKQNLKRPAESEAEIEIQDSSSDSEVIVEIIPGMPRYVKKYSLKPDSQEKCDEKCDEKGGEEAATKEELSKQLETELNRLTKTIESNKIELKYLKSATLDLVERQDKLENGLKKVRTIAAKLDKQVQQGNFKVLDTIYNVDW